VSNQTYIPDDEATKCRECGEVTRRCGRDHDCGVNCCICESDIEVVSFYTEPYEAKFQCRDLHAGTFTLSEIESELYTAAQEVGNYQNHAAVVWKIFSNFMDRLKNIQNGDQNGSQ